MAFAKRFVAGDPKAAEFREFWGERSQLRRFQDGVVKEVVVWGDKKEEVVGKSEERSSLHLHFPLVWSEYFMFCIKQFTGSV
jgi:hypothetical protein